MKKVSNKNLTIKKIWDNQENKFNSDTFKPHWTFEFEDGTKAKLKKEQEGASELRAMVSEGTQATFTIEQGSTDDGKPWYAIRDILNPVKPTTKTQASTSPKPTVPQQNPTSATMSGQAFGNRLTAATQIIVAKIGSGKLDVSQVEAEYDRLFAMFKRAEDTGSFEFPF